MNITFESYIATSLDGYIARLNGKLDWLDGATEKDSKEDYGYFDFMASIDCIVMGRSSFEKVASFPEWPYQGKRVIVLSKTMKDAPEPLTHKVDFFNGKVELLAVELQNLGLKKVYVDGGLTVQSFIDAKLLDAITITQIPVLIGRGIPLFAEKSLSADIKMQLVKSQSYASGFVQSKYNIEYPKGRFFE